MDSYVNPANNYESQHDGSEDLAINNTTITRFIVRLALRTTATLFHRQGPCTPISRHRIVKTGHSVHLTEAATMKYIAEHTSIPVPRVYSAFLHKNRAHIVMERVQGKELARAWKGLQEESLQKILSQLEKMVRELRALQPPPGTGVESCVKGSLYDSRLPNGTPRFGPFATIQDFHRWLRDNLEASQIGDHVTKEEADDLRAMIAKQEGQWSLPIFTHCDLNPFNILVSGDKIVGIIDWESSGWYPPYWEFTTAWFGNRTRAEWQGILHSLLHAYPEELEMERTRNKWWGEW